MTPAPQPSEAAWERARVLATTSCVHGYRYDKDERGNEARRVAMDCMECVALAFDGAFAAVRAEGEAAENERICNLVFSLPVFRMCAAEVVANIRARGEAKP